MTISRTDPIQEVNLEKGLIEIKKGKAKTRSRRLVPITPNLALFLKGVEEAERTGPVWAQSEPFLFDLMRDAGNDSGVKWKHNALRLFRTGWPKSKT